MLFFLFFGLFLLLVLDSSILVSVMLSKHWSWISNADTEGGRIALAIFFAILAFLIEFCSRKVEDPRHRFAALFGTSLLVEESTHLFHAFAGMMSASIILIGWVCITYFGKFSHIPFLTETWGKWLFTAVCTWFFAGWFTQYDGYVSRSRAIFIQTVEEEYGKLLGFFYSWSGPFYIMIKLLLLILLMLTIIIVG
jgi:hypothetical protein